MTVIPDSVVQALADEGFAATDIEGLTISANDVRRAGFCASGMRAWLGEHDLSLNAIVEGTMPAEDLAATGDAYAVKVIVARLKRGL